MTTPHSPAGMEARTESYEEREIYTLIGKLSQPNQDRVMELVRSLARCVEYHARPSAVEAPKWTPTKACIVPTAEAADAFWKFWRENGETHKHGYYESTWGAINAALNSTGQLAPTPPAGDAETAELIERLEAITANYGLDHYDDADKVLREIVAALRALAARLAEAEATIADCNANYDALFANLTAVKAERDAAILRAEAAERDAARYRWLRDDEFARLSVEVTYSGVRQSRKWWCAFKTAEQLDDAVDAALASSAGEKP